MYISFPDEDDFDPLQSDSLSMLLSSTTPPVSSYDGVIPIADNSDCKLMFS